MVNGQGMRPKADIFVEPNPMQPMDKIKPEKVKPAIKADEVIAFAKFIDRNRKPFSTWLS